MAFADILAQQDRELTFQAITPEEEQRYLEEFARTQALFGRLTDGRPEVNARHLDDECHRARVHRPVDLGAHDIGGEQRKVLVQPRQDIWTDRGTEVYSRELDIEVIPGTESNFGLEFFAVKAGAALDAGSLERALTFNPDEEERLRVDIETWLDAVFRGSAAVERERAPDKATECLDFASVLTYEPDDEGRPGVPAYRDGLDEIVAFNQLLGEVLELAVPAAGRQSS